MRHNPRCAIFQELPGLRDDSDCNCGAILPLRSSRSLEEAIIEIELRKRTIPIDQEMIVRIEELDHILGILRQVRP